MQNKKWWKTLSVILLGTLLAGFVIVPLPYYVEAPGATIDLKDMITVNDQEDKESGSFSLTSVGIRRATGFGVVSALMSDFKDVISEEELTGGATNEEYNQMQKYYMESSQNAAIEQALKLANIPYTMEFKGVYVMGVEKNSSFYKKLSVGDTVTKVAINSGSIGGPSAGLMFTLEIYEQLTHQNIRKGKKIAGTGTINSAGEVGRIGGIDKKVASADEAGMNIFFAPDDTISDEVKKENPDIKTNYEEAKAAAKKLNTSMKIVPVKTVQDALEYLENMK